MGGSSSKAENVVESTTNVMLDIVNETLQQCTTPVSQVQQSDIVQGDGGIIEGVTFGFRQGVAIDIQCVTSTETINDLDTDIQRTVTQQAEAVTSSLGLPWGSSEANNITRSITNLGTSIRNAYRQECGGIVAQTQTSSIRQGDGGIIRNVDFNFEQTSDNVINCIQNAVNVNNAKTNLLENINQEAEAVVEGFKFPIWAFVIIGVVLITVLVVIGLITFFIIRGVTSTGSKYLDVQSGVTQSLIKTTGEVLVDPNLAQNVEAIGSAAAPIALAAATGGASIPVTAALGAGGSALTSGLM